MLPLWRRGPAGPVRPQVLCQGLPPVVPGPGQAALWWVPGHPAGSWGRVPTRVVRGQGRVRVGTDSACLTTGSRGRENWDLRGKIGSPTQGQESEAL